MRVFLDANVIFSAAYMVKGSPRALYDLAQAGACEIVSSGYAMEEARRNILAKQAGRAGDLEELLGRTVMCAEPLPTTLAWALGLGLPDKDAPILAAAVDAGCGLLVTGDATHFGLLFGTRQRNTVILRPAGAIEVLVPAS